MQIIFYCGNNKMYIKKKKKNRGIELKSNYISQDTAENKSSIMSLLNCHCIALFFAQMKNIKTSFIRSDAQKT